MLQVTDVSQTRVFKEALEEGLVKGRQEGIEKGVVKGIAAVALRLLKMGRPIAEIARATDLPPASAARSRFTSKPRS